MNHLIIGGAGFIGLHLAESLILDKENVTIIDNFQRGKNDLTLKKLIAKGLKVLDFDLTKNFKISKVKNTFNYIYNFAAIIGVKNVINDPYKVLINNILIQDRSIAIAQKQKNIKKFFFASTSEVYAASLKNKLIKFPTPEKNILCVDSFTNKRSSYMLSKIYCEMMCYQSSLPFTIARFHNIYGPRMGMDHVIPQLSKKIYKKKKIKLENYNHSRTFCYIDDAVNYIKKLSYSKKSSKKIYNIGNQKPLLSIQKLAFLISKNFNKKIKITKCHSKNQSPKKRQPNISELKKIIKNNNITGIESGIAKTVKWYFENGYYE